MSAPFRITLVIEPDLVPAERVADLAIAVKAVADCVLPERGAGEPLAWYIEAEGDALGDAVQMNRRVLDRRAWTGDVAAVDLGTDGPFDAVGDHA